MFQLHKQINPIGKNKNKNKPKIPEGKLKSELEAEDEEQHGEDDDDACEDDLIGPSCETLLRLTIRGCE